MDERTTKYEPQREPRPLFQTGDPVEVTTRPFGDDMRIENGNLLALDPMGILIEDEVGPVLYPMTSVFCIRPCPKPAKH